MKNVPFHARLIAWTIRKLLLGGQNLSFRKVGPVLVSGSPIRDSDILRALNNLPTRPHMSLLTRHPQRIVIWKHDFGKNPNPLVDTSFFNDRTILNLDSEDIAMIVLFRAFMCRLSCFGIVVNRRNRDRIRRIFAKSYRLE